MPFSLIPLSPLLMQNSRFPLLSARLSLFCAVVTAFIGFSNAKAQLYWNPGSLDHAGIWDASTANWNTSFLGLPGTQSVYTQGSNTVFSVGNSTTGSYSVTLQPGFTPIVGGIDFQQGHVTIRATLDINSSTATPANGDVEVITLTGTPTINVQNMDALIGTRIQGGTGLTKTGVGKLTLDYGRVGGQFFILGNNRTLTINGGSVELKGVSSSDSLQVGTIEINRGGSFIYGGVNSIQNGVIIDIRAGGTLVANASDYMGAVRGEGLIQLNGSANLKMGGNTASTFSGQITGTGALTYRGGSAAITLSGINSFTGNIFIGGASGNQDYTTVKDAVGGLALGNKRAAQLATLNLLGTNTAGTSLRFADLADKTFILGGLTGGSNQDTLNRLLLQDVSGNAITLQVGNNNTSTTFSGILTGTGGLTKIGTGTLTLTGHYNTTTTTATGNSYTGTTAVNAGTANGLSAGPAYSTSTLRLDFNTSTISPQNNIISADSHLSLGGGTLQVQGRNDASVSQTFDGTSFNPGASRITLTNGSGSSQTVLNLGAFADRSVSRGGLVVFTLPSGTQTATNGITTTTGNTNGILGAWATIGNDWATVTSNGTNNNIHAFTAYNVLTGTAPILTSNVAANYRLDASSTLSALTGGSTASNSNVITVADTSGLAVGQYVSGTGLPANAQITEILSATTFKINANATGATSGQTYYNSNAVTVGGAGLTDINTLQITATGRVVEIGTGNTLRLGAAGGIWQLGTATGFSSIGTTTDAGTLTAGGADNTPGEIVLTGNLSVYSKISDNGTGAVTVIKGAAGELTLWGNNNYTGGTVIALGRLTNRTSTALGTGPVTILPGGQLFMNANIANDFIISGAGSGEAVVPGAIRMSSSTITGTVTLAGDAVIGTHTGTGLATNTITGRITGDYQLGISAGNDGGGRFTLLNTNNDFTGGLNINGLNGITNQLTSQNVTVRIGASEVIPHGTGKGNVILTGGQTDGKLSTLDLFGFTETINGLVSAGVGTRTRITNESTTADARLILGSNDATASFAGSIVDGTKTVGITKIGEGIQTFSGSVNTYSGETRINQGSLQAGASNAFSPNSAIVMADAPGTMLNLADFPQVILSLSGYGTVNLGTAAATPTTGAILSTGAAADTIYYGDIVGAGGLKKQGLGRFTLSGENTYLGSTEVSQGNLQVGIASIGQTGSGPVTVQSGATLSGSGIVRGATTILGTLRPGDLGGTNIGTLTFTDFSTGSLSLTGSGAGARAQLTLAGATGRETNPMSGITTPTYLNGNAGNHDHITVGGTLTLAAGNIIEVRLTDGYEPLWGDVFNLFDWGTLNGGSSAIQAGGFNPNTDLDLQISTAMLANGWFWETNQFLTHGIIYVVPEPSRALLILAGLAGILLPRGRRRTV